MNRQTFLSIYERLEAIISKLPGPLQSAVMGELKPIKEIFLSQRFARIVLVGKPNADASALFSGLLGSDLQMTETKQTGGWITYELRGRGGFRVLDARRLNETSLTWNALAARFLRKVPICLCFSWMEADRSIWASNVNKQVDCWIWQSCATSPKPV
jgi:hypothetical protein